METEATIKDGPNIPDVGSSCSPVGFPGRSAPGSRSAYHSTLKGGGRSHTKAEGNNGERVSGAGAWVRGRGCAVRGRGCAARGRGCAARVRGAGARRGCAARVRGAEAWVRGAVSRETRWWCGGVEWQPTTWTRRKEPHRLAPSETRRAPGRPRQSISRSPEGQRAGAPASVDIGTGRDEHAGARLWRA